ncbi:MAG: IclR family transcriptional regulator [Peptoniphilus sp.]|nr:IclR family transcriptional regulator [Peptoniphilus sp.]MDD7363600.1 IclR family transcriptional regulator [Bacillota bacterium]MDY6045209.1 IclR family transcriptional regulator [Peptoniphilus sp.]
MDKNPRTIQSLARAFAILDCFDSVHPRLTITEISDIVHLNVNTTRGLVNTLVHFQYLSRDDEENDYYLGLAFIPKANLVEDQYLFHIKNKIQPMLREWANIFELSARLNMVDDGQLMTVFTEVPDNTRYLIMTRSRTPFPLHATASGKAYLSSLPDTVVDTYIRDTRLVKYTDLTITEADRLVEELNKTRERGYALEIGEINEGIGSVAIPITDKRKECIGTISLSGTNGQILQEETRIWEMISEFLNNLQPLG